MNIQVLFSTFFPLFILFFFISWLCEELQYAAWTLGGVVSFTIILTFSGPLVSNSINTVNINLISVLTILIYFIDIFKSPFVLKKIIGIFTFF